MYGILYGWYFLLIYLYKLQLVIFGFVAQRFKR